MRETNDTIIQQLPVNLYGERDADLQMQKQMFIIQIVNRWKHE